MDNLNNNNYNNYQEKISILEVCTDSLLTAISDNLPFDLNTIRELTQNVSTVSHEIARDRLLTATEGRNLTQKLQSVSSTIELISGPAMNVREKKKLSDEDVRKFLYNAVPEALEETLNELNNFDLVTNANLEDRDAFIYGSLVAITMAKLLKSSQNIQGMILNTKTILTADNCPEIFVPLFVPCLKLKDQVNGLSAEQFKLLLKACIDNPDIDKDGIPEGINRLAGSIQNIVIPITQRDVFKKIFEDVVEACRASCKK